MTRTAIVVATVLNVLISIFVSTSLFVYVASDAISH